MANRMASPEQAAKYKEKARKWREANKAARRDYDRKWKEQNPERYKELTSRARKKRSAKPEVRIVSNFRKRLREIMSDARNGGKQSTLKLIGCSSSELAAHLESQFKRGMTWENYGTHWHVDHIIPCAAFDHTKPEQLRQCWHFTNLRPLEAKVNLAKGAKIEAPQLQLLLTH
jgi:5-methylcytosine-specific restriction endonuclease McrA